RRGAARARRRPRRARRSQRQRRSGRGLLLRRRRAARAARGRGARKRAGVAPGALPHRRGHLEDRTMTRACLALPALLLLAACGSKPPPAAPPTSRPAPLAAPRVTPGSLDVRALLVDLPDRAARAGAGPMSLVASGEAYEGERLGAFVDVPADACLLG